MLLSGVSIEVGAGGSFHATWWYRVSILLLILVGALNGFARRRLKKDLQHGIRFMARVSWLECTLVAAITLLMTFRPG
jgi:hypothetical protein